VLAVKLFFAEHQNIGDSTVFNVNAYHFRQLASELVRIIAPGFYAFVAMNRR
jgi:hypothetical protein